MAGSKANVQEEQDTVENVQKSKTKEAEYLVSELIDASDQLFSHQKGAIPKECVIVALNQAKKERMTVSEAKKVIEAFMKKEVK